MKSEEPSLPGVRCIVWLGLIGAIITRDRNKNFACPVDAFNWVGLSNGQPLPAKLVNSVAVNSYHASEQIQPDMVSMFARRAIAEKIMLALTALDQSALPITDGATKCPIERRLHSGGRLVLEAIPNVILGFRRHGEWR